MQHPPLICIARDGNQDLPKKPVIANPVRTLGVAIPETLQHCRKNMSLRGAQRRGNPRKVATLPYTPPDLASPTPLINEGGEIPPDLATLGHIEINV